MAKNKIIVNLEAKIALIKKILERKKEKFEEIEKNPKSEAKCYEFTQLIIDKFKEKNLDEIGDNETKFAKSSGKNVPDYPDINLLFEAGRYQIAIKNPNSFKQLIDKSRLITKKEERNVLKEFIDKNSAEKFGMFGKGLGDLGTKCNGDFVRKFIKACINVIDMEDTEPENIFKEFEFLEKIDDGDSKSGTISQILHCLKPKIFPIVNQNQGYGNLFKMYYDYLKNEGKNIEGCELKNLKQTNNYIANCRAILKLREKFCEENECSYKNYRIYDIIASQALYSPALNQILYGPPGTGKTYNTVVKAMEIIDGVTYTNISDDDYKNLKEKFNAELGNHIEFITFHQSYSYEEFVEGIKPYIPEWGKKNVQDIKYVGKDGIFKKLAKKALFNMLAIEDAYKMSYSVFETAKNKFIENHDVGTLMKTCTGTEFIISEYTDNNIRIKPVNGETKYYLSYEYIKELLERLKDSVDIQRKDIIDKIPTIEGTASYYLSIIKELIKLLNPEQNDTNKSYDNDDQFKEQAIKDFYAKDKKDGDGLKEIEKTEPYILIIDEINRGNISKIFGELITLIEDDKRAGADNSMTVTLPYSGEHFTVPKNLYIIGTMNTADRSIDLLDTALRRRFSFEEIMPDPDLLSSDEFIKISKEKKYSPKDFLKTVNGNIEDKYDRNHQIGHAYLIGVENEEDFEEAFNKKIYPLLQEYFYNDADTIDKVLGENYKKLKPKE